MKLMLWTSGLLACRHPAFAPHYVVFFHCQKRRLLFLANQTSAALPTRPRKLLTVCPFECDRFHLSLLDFPQFISADLSRKITSPNRTIRHSKKPVDRTQISKTAIKPPHLPPLPAQKKIYQSINLEKKKK